jgi:16S rRNA (adenine1518-N6/adenine1519-N6)-dimethyltransferase
MHSDDGSGENDLTAGPLTPSATRALLESLGHQPRKRLGQNFLIDGNIVRKSLQLAGIAAGDQVVEVGPGLGTLSSALLAAGAEVWAVELDATLAEHLRGTKGAHPHFHLHEGDAVDAPTAGFTPVEGGYKIVANLPYAITSPWMDGVLSGPLPACMVLMMQKEAADRLTAQPGSKAFSAIAIFLQALFTIEGRHAVSRQCFFPAPGVDSVLLALRRRPDPLRFTTEARSFIRMLFTQRRKQIGSLVRGHPAGEAWVQSLEEIGVAPTTRPEAIPQAAWHRLADIR